MAALVATRHNPIIKDFYQRLLAVGKTTRSIGERGQADAAWTGSQPGGRRTWRLLEAGAPGPLQSPAARADTTSGGLSPARGRPRRRPTRFLVPENEPGNAS